MTCLSTLMGLILIDLYVNIPLYNEGGTDEFLEKEMTKRVKRIDWKQLT